MANDGGDADIPPPPGEDDKYHDAQLGFQQAAGQQQQFGFNPAAPPFVWPPPLPGCVAAPVGPAACAATAALRAGTEA